MENNNGQGSGWTVDNSEDVDLFHERAVIENPDGGNQNLTPAWWTSSPSDYLYITIEDTGIPPAGTRVPKFELKVCKYSTSVSELKTLVWRELTQKHGINGQLEFKLFFRNKELDEHDKLLRSCITVDEEGHSVIFLVWKNSTYDNFKVTVTVAHEEDSYTFHCWPALKDSTMKLKQEFSNARDGGKYNLWFNGQLLQDNQPLVYYGIGKNDIIRAYAANESYYY